MPISGPSSYLPTTDEFLAHWNSANGMLGGVGVVLGGGTTYTDLLGLRDSLSTARNNVTDAGVERALARETLTELITKLQSRLVKFNERVRADLAGSTIARVLPAAFAVGDAEGTVRDTLRQMLRLWTKINALSPTPAGLVLPLTLLAGYGLTDFATDCDTLRDLYHALSTAEVELGLARENRNDLQDKIHEILKAYRLKLPTVFPEGHALLDSLPALTPAGGHTPDAVVAVAGWDVPSTKGKITWGESTDADLARYEVRGVAGDTYVTADETVLAAVAAGGTRELLTDFALSISGVTAGFKVYVVLHTGNERGSEAVFVTRP